MSIEIKSRWDASKAILVIKSESLRDADLRGADLRAANLRGADLRGANLRVANLCVANLRGADLRGADLRDADLRDADLRDADLRDADLCVANLRGADLRDADLRDADLRGAYLRGANLCVANLRDAQGLPFVTPTNDLDGQILARITDGQGRLEMARWHTCETTHCRAGWAITLSPVGKTLESILGANAAGALIYAAAYPTLKIPNFIASNEDALADIKSRAALVSE